MCIHSVIKECPKVTSAPFLPNFSICVYSQLKGSGFSSSIDSVDSDKALQEKEAELRRMQEMLDQMQRQITLQKQQGGQA